MRRMWRRVSPRAAYPSYVRDHKSLKAWQEAHWVAMAAVDLAESYWKPSLRSVYDQLTSAALPAQINIAEGYALGTKPMFVRHLRIAYGSSIETADLLELLAERLVIPVATASSTLEHSRLCQRLLLGLLRKSSHR